MAWKKAMNFHELPTIEYEYSKLFPHFPVELFMDVWIAVYVSQALDQCSFFGQILLHLILKRCVFWLLVTETKKLFLQVIPSTWHGEKKWYELRMGLYKNGGVSTGFCPSIVTWKTRSWKIISLNSFIPSAKCSVQCVESCDSFQLIQFHSKSMPKLGNLAWFCFQVRFTSWVSLLLLSVHERPRPAVMRRARSIGIYIAMPSNAILFFFLDNPWVEILEMEDWAFSCLLSI